MSKFHISKRIDHCDQLIENLRPGDLLCIKSIDCLGESYDEILWSWHWLTEKKQVDLMIENVSSIDTRNGKEQMDEILCIVIPQILSAAEESKQRERRTAQAKGIAEAKAKGVQFGRPAIEVPDNFPRIVQMWKSKRITMEEALTLSGMSASTFYRRRRNLKEQDEMS